MRLPGYVILSVLLVVVLTACDGRPSASDEYAAGLQAMESGELTQATIHLKSALQQNDGLNEARVLLGRTYLLSGDPVSAAKEYERVIDADDVELATRFEYAEVLLALRRYDEVLAIVKQHPDAARGHIIAGRARLGLGEHAAAQGEFAAALEDREQSAAAQIGLARLALLKRDLVAAEKASEQARAAAPEDVEACLLEGQIANAKGDVAATRSAYTRCLELERYDVSATRNSAHAALASLALRQIEPATASPHIDFLQRISPEHPGYRYLRATQLFQQEQFDKAKTLLLENLRVVPGHTDTLALAGAVEFRLGNLNQAREYLERALVSQPDSDFVKKSLGSLYVQTGLRQEAVDILEPLANKHPEDSDLAQILGAAYLANGQSDAAAAAFNRALEIDPTTTDARAGLAMSYLANDDTARTIDELQDAVEKNPDFARGEYLIAVALYKDGKLDEALAAVKALLEKQPDVPAYSNLLGTVQQARREKDAAKAAFRRAVAADPRYVIAAMNLAALEVSDGNWDEAQAIFEGVLAVQPNHPGALHGLAIQQFVAGNEQAALARWEQARAHNSGDLRSRLYLADAHFKAGRFDKGLAVADEALALAPADPAVLLVAARLHLIQGALDTARGHARKLLEVAPDSYQANYINALIDIRRGDLGEGKARLERALAIEPESRAARNLLENLAEKAGMSLSSAIHETSPGDSVGQQVQHYLRTDEPGRALAMAREHAQANSSDPGAQFLLAGTYMAAREFDAARTVLQKVLTDYPASIAARMNLAGLENLAGNPDEARKWYGTVLEREPQNQNALLELANLSSPEEAGKLVRRAYEADPSSDRTMLALAKHEIQQGNFPAAEAVVAKLHQRAPMEPEILNLAVRTYLGMGNRSKAAEIADHYAKSFPQNSDALVLRGMVHMARADYDTARASLERAVDLDARNIGALILLSELEFAAGNLDRADERAQQILGLGSEIAQTQRLVADIAWRRGNKAAAVAAYRRALEIEASPAYVISLARALWAAGEPTEGRALLESALTKEPENVSMRNALAEIFYAEGDYLQAAEAYREVVAAKPADGLVTDKLAEVYELAGDSRALATAKKAHELLPEHVETLSTYGWLLVKEGSTQQGLSLLQKAVTRLDGIADPAVRATIQFQLAEALRKSGQRDAARRELERLLSSNIVFPERELAERLLNR